MKGKVFVFLGSAVLLAGVAAAGEKGAHWGYSGEGGPGHWGSLSPDYALCGSGQNQSPVDITGALETDLPELGFACSASGLGVVNNGHTIMVSCPEGSTLSIGEKVYSLKQFHFHTPSENRIDGQSFPMEAHLVHADGDGKLAVVSVMFAEGGENPVIARIWEKMPAEAGEEVKAEEVLIDPAGLLPADRDYYRFNGSLTTPPCTEGVTWVVMKKAVEASAEQIALYEKTMHGDTNRPVQPLNARIVLK